MKLFPTKRLEFRLVGTYDETLNRLIRRTEESEKLTSQYTDRSFRGIVNGNQFKLISSAVGRGAFCVMTGAIENGGGYVEVEVHKVFRIFLSIFLLAPVIGFISIVVSETEAFSPVMILVAIGQILIIRFGFIGLTFRLLSRESLSRLRDVLDLEWVVE